MTVRQYEIDIQNFKKGKRINQGGFGTIYEATEKKTGILYAAKRIDCNDNLEQCKEIIKREVSILAFVNHPTIIKFIGYSLVDFFEENNITIIMQYAKNGSLDSILKSIQNSNGPKDYTNTTRQIILIGIARGMKYLHDRNIIHRDLKSDNILINEKFHPMITDFGFSKMFSFGHSKSQSQFYGTLSYTAPEIIEENEYDRKADVYSFGILMFEVVMDSVPYPDLMSGKIKQRKFQKLVVEEDYRPEFKFPVKKEIKELIQQCWSKEPKDRPTFKEILAKLSSNHDYFLEDVDEDDVLQYVEDITEINDPIDELNNINEQLESENNQLRTEIHQLQDENSINLKTISKQKIEIKRLKKIEDENSKNIKIISNKEEEIKRLKKVEDENSKNIKIISNKEEEIQKLKKENSQLKAEIDELKNSKKIEEPHKLFPLPSTDQLNMLDIETYNYLLYKKVSKIGRGSISTTYKVKNIYGNNGYLCLKVCEVDDQLNFENMKKFLKEYEILYNLNHPNIVKAYGFFCGDEKIAPAILLEYCGTNIQKAINSLDEADLVGIIYEICLAMKFIHEKKIIHRDLKMSNILLDDNNHVKICDFSLSRLNDSEFSLTNGIGTLAFMAPELLDESDYNEKIDVYAFGVVMYFIVTKGQLPKRKGFQNSYESIEFPKSINYLSKSIIHKCWSSSSRERPSFAMILNEIVKNNFALFNGIEKQIPRIKKHLGL